VTVAIDFPNSPPPSNGDTFTAINGITYRYNNGKWKGIVNSGPADQLINGPKTIRFESSGILSSDAGNTIRLRSSGQGGATSIEYTGNVNNQTPYDSKVEARGQEIFIHAAGDTRVWGFDAYGQLNLPVNDSGDSVIQSDTGNVELYTNKTSNARVGLRAKGSNGDKLWSFKDDGSILFPDETAQTTAYRNRPLTNLNLSGGTASTIFEIDMTYVDCGGSVLRGILAQDQYDGYDNGSTTTSFDKVLDGGQA
jgi:hypothetical protein